MNILYRITLLALVLAYNQAQASTIAVGWKPAIIEQSTSLNDDQRKQINTLIEDVARSLGYQAVVPERVREFEINHQSAVDQCVTPSCMEDLRLAFGPDVWFFTIRIVGNPAQQACSVFVAASSGTQSHRSGADQVGCNVAALGAKIEVQMRQLGEQLRTHNDLPTVATTAVVDKNLPPNYKWLKAHHWVTKQGDQYVVSPVVWERYQRRATVHGILGLVSLAAAVALGTTAILETQKNYGIPEAFGIPAVAALGFGTVNGILYGSNSRTSRHHHKIYAPYRAQRAAEAPLYGLSLAYKF